MEGVREGFVIHDNVEVTALYKVVKVLDGQIHGQQLTIEGAVLLLGGSKLLGEVRKGAPPVVDPLLENCTHG